MLQKIQDFYSKNAMYVNIAVGSVVVYFIWKATKK